MHAKLSEAVPLEEYSEQQRLDSIIMKLKFSAAAHFKDKINRYYDPLPESEKNMSKVYEILDNWLAEERDAETYTTNPEYVKALGLNLKESRRNRRGREWERDNERHWLNTNTTVLTKKQQEALDRNSNAGNPNQVKPGGPGWNNKDPKIYNPKFLCYFFVTPGMTCKLGEKCVEQHLMPRMPEDLKKMQTIEERKARHIKMGIRVSGHPAPTSDGRAGSDASRSRTPSNDSRASKGSQGSKTSKGSSQGGRSLSTNSSFGSFSTTKSTKSYLNAAVKGKPRKMVCCANGQGCPNIRKERGLSHFPKQPDGTYVKEGYTAVNKMVARSFGRYSDHPKIRRSTSKKDIPRKDGRSRKRANGKRTDRSGKGSGKKDRKDKRKGSRGKTPPPRT